MFLVVFVYHGPDDCCQFQYQYRNHASNWHQMKINDFFLPTPTPRESLTNWITYANKVPDAKSDIGNSGERKKYVINWNVSKLSQKNSFRLHSWIEINWTFWRIPRFNRHASLLSGTTKKFNPMKKFAGAELILNEPKKNEFHLIQAKGIQCASAWMCKYFQIDLAVKHWNISKQFVHRRFLLRFLAHEFEWKNVECCFESYN